MFSSNVSRISELDATLKYIDVLKYMMILIITEIDTAKNTIIDKVKVRSN